MTILKEGVCGWFQLVFIDFSYFIFKPGSSLKDVPYFNGRISITYAIGAGDMVIGTPLTIDNCLDYIMVQETN